MKKFGLLLFSIFILISCNNDDSAAEPGNGKLVRVDFMPGLNGETRWLFNSDELLTDIVKADGTPIEKFVYDAQGNLVQNITYNTNGTINSTYNITYDSSGFVHQINSADYNYSYYDHKYFYVNGFNTLECELGSNDLLKQAQNTYDDAVDQYITNYNCNYNTDGNLISYDFHGPFVDSWKTFTYDSHTNPIKHGVMAILKAKSIYDPWFFTDGTSSSNNIIAKTFDDVENATYAYEFNSNGLPVTQTQSFYNMNVLQNTYVTAKYYYQGDVLP
ncbi:hypothetical protein [Flavobacterium terrisoli]|uniref:hypothetical protein n=1 Tax=Flavobacterium terrisoli TaxID=3242195 RepID=UPI0025438F4E|nr:hypothetical protein [Flavobacterium buctense]